MFAQRKKSVRVATGIVCKAHDNTKNMTTHNEVHVLSLYLESVHDVRCMTVYAHQVSALRVIRCRSNIGRMPGQLERLWVPCDQVPAGSIPLKVFQWNLLADGLAQHGDFIKVWS